MGDLLKTYWQRRRSEVTFHLPEEARWIHKTVISSVIMDDKDLQVKHRKAHYQSQEKGDETCSGEEEIAQAGPCEVFS